MQAETLEVGHGPPPCPAQCLCQDSRHCAPSGHGLGPHTCPTSMSEDTRSFSCPGLQLSVGKGALLQEAQNWRQR